MQIFTLKGLPESAMLNFKLSILYAKIPGRMPVVQYIATVGMMKMMMTMVTATVISMPFGYFMYFPPKSKKSIL